MKLSMKSLVIQKLITNASLGFQNSLTGRMGCEIGWMQYAYETAIQTFQARERCFLFPRH
jgi:hypothetical protein